MPWIIIEKEGGTKIGSSKAPFTTIDEAQAEFDQIVEMGLFLSDQIEIKETS